MTDSNLLVTIPGQYIAQGSRNLPNADTSTDETLQAVVDVPNIGRVRLTYKRFSHKRSRSHYFFWTVESAELIGAELGGD